MRKSGFLAVSHGWSTNPLNASYNTAKHSALSDAEHSQEQVAEGSDDDHWARMPVNC